MSVEAGPCSFSQQQRLFPRQTWLLVSAGPTAKMQGDRHLGASTREEVGNRWRLRDLPDQRLRAAAAASASDGSMAEEWSFGGTLNDLIEERQRH